MDRPKVWYQLADEVLQKGSTALLLGAPDTGKTTLCHFLVEEALKRGLRTAYIDADVGQSVIGPPTTLGMALLEGPQEELSGLEADRLYFIGATSPARHLLPVVVGLRKLLDEAWCRGAEFAIVDTTGLVSGEVGLILKFYKVEALRPKHLIALEGGSEVEHILRPLWGREDLKVHVLLPSPKVVRRDQRRRQDYRMEKFRSYFKEASLKEVDLRERTLISPALPLHQGGDDLKGRLIGLIDGDGFAVGLGIIEDLHGERVSIWTPLEELQGVRFLQVGSLIFSRRQGCL